MAGSVRGPAPKPRLQTVKEGNPGHKVLPPDLHLPPGRPDEPDWAKRFPIRSGEPDDAAVEITSVAEVARCREVAALRWEQWVPVLDSIGQLAGNVDQAAVEEACVLAALVDRCDRVVAITPITATDSNRAVTASNTYRSQLYKIMAMCGLAPGARSWMKPREAQDGPSPVWDA